MVKGNRKQVSQLGVFFAAMGLSFLLSAFIVIQFKQYDIVLKDSKFNFTLHKFYIIDVADGRVNRTYTAMLLEKGQSSPIQFDLKGGAIHSVKVFLNRNLHSDTLLRPVLLTIKDFNLIETVKPSGAVHGEMKVNFSFSSQLSYENKHLVDFIEKISYNRPFNKSYNVEPYLRRGITNGLNYFNNWSNNVNQ